MSFLSAQKIIHRDLALRNLLYEPGYERKKLCVKVSDLGLGGSTKDFRKSDLLPVNSNLITEVF